MAGSEVNRKSLIAAALSGFGMLFSTGPVVFATFALFMLPMARSFGWGRGDISGALLICAGCAAIADPVVGRLVDRWGARRVLLPGLAAFALANAGLALVTPSLATLYLLFALVGVTSATCAAVPYSKVLSTWFGPRRGLVLGLSLGVGAGAGAALMPQLARLLIEQLGWRNAHLGLAAIIALIGLPMLALFLRERAVAPMASGAATPPSAPGATAASSRRDPTFWLMFGMIFTGTTALAGTVIHMVAFFTDRGLSMTTATAIYSSYAIANIVGHVLIGVLQDRLQTPRIGLVVYGCALAGVVLISRGDSLPVLWAGALLVGLGFGAEVSLGAYWVSRYWGMRSYGEIFGLLYSASSAGVAVGPLVMGVMFDRTGSYASPLAGFEAALGACLLLTLTLKPYVYAADGRTRTADPTATAARSCVSSRPERPA